MADKSMQFPSTACSSHPFPRSCLPQRKHWGFKTKDNSDQDGHHQRGAFGPIDSMGRTQQSPPLPRGATRLSVSQIGTSFHLCVYQALSLYTQASGVPINKELEVEASQDPVAERDREQQSDVEAEPTLERQLSQGYTPDRLELDEELALEKTKSKPISLHKSADGVILVDWYATDDPANPQNWSSGKKLFVLIQIWYDSTNIRCVCGLVTDGENAASTALPCMPGPASTSSASSKSPSEALQPHPV